MQVSKKHRDYWRKNLRVTAILLSIWFVVTFVASYFDRAYRRNPARALAMVGLLVAPSAALTPLQYTVHSRVWFVILGVP